MHLLPPLLLLLTSLLPLTSAQFQFFEQMFNQGGQQQPSQHPQHQEKQNVPSDSAWYQRNYDAGTLPPIPPIPHTIPQTNIPYQFQRIAQTTSAPKPSHACTSRTIARARFRRRKRRWSWGRAARCVLVKRGGGSGGRGGRLRGRGGGFCERSWGVKGGMALGKREGIREDNGCTILVVR